MDIVKVLFVKNKKNAKCMNLAIPSIGGVFGSNIVFILFAIRYYRQATDGKAIHTVVSG